MSDRTGGMGKLAAKSAAAVDAELSETETALLLRSRADLARLKPRITDQQSFAKLVAAVNRATQENDDVASLSDTIKGLGEEVVKVAKVATSLLG